MSRNRLSIVANSQRIGAAEEEPADRMLSGKVVHDARGTAVWDWAIETGVLAKRSAADLLTTLGQDALSLEGEPDPQDWSGDPYNRPAR